MFGTATHSRIDNKGILTGGSMVPCRYDVLGLCNVTEGDCQLPWESSFDTDVIHAPKIILGEIIFLKDF